VIGAILDEHQAAAGDASLLNASMIERGDPGPRVAGGSGLKCERGQQRRGSQSGQSTTGEKIT